MENYTIKWYCQAWFIGLCFCFSFLIIPFIIGVILTVMHYLRLKEITTKANAVADVIKYREKVELDKEIAEQEIKDSKEHAAEEIEKYQQKIEKDCELKISKTNDEFSNLQQKIYDLNSNIELKKNELAALDDSLFQAYTIPYQFDNNITSEEYKNKLSILKARETEFMKPDKCIQYMQSDIPKKQLNNDIKQLLRCFNSEAQNIIVNTTIKNVDTCRTKLQRTYETLNKLFVTDGISLKLECLELKLEELNLQYSYLKKQEIEKEQQKAIKEQMIEEEKVRREIEREKAKLEKEENQFKNEISKLMGYLQKDSEVEKQLYVDKIKELEAKLKQIDADRENILQREQNTRAGFVYVISNIGSFGENIYKIGMTRRLEPMDRVKELGSASVPFEFDVHAMIFSEDAPALENILHKTFESCAVNKVNPRKEFFKVPLKEIEKIVTENHNATVTFTELAKAEQYRESLKIEAAQIQ